MKNSKGGAGANLASVLDGSPELVAVLERYGVHVCAGCLLTLTAPVERAAAYHGVPDVLAFLSALGLARRSGPRRPGPSARPPRGRGRSDGPRRRPKP